MVSRKEILDILSNVPLPEGFPVDGENVIDAGIVSSVVIRDNSVGFALEIPKNHKITPDIEALRQACEAAVLKVKGVENVTVVLTAENLNPPTPISQAASAARPSPPSPKALPNISHIIGVASGKGGVGKSTIATNIAIALAQKGHKVGLVDADILGPSVAKMMGNTERPAIENEQLIPHQEFGIKCLSMGMLIDENTATIWRGPMVSKAIQKLFRGADWGTLDYLIIDFPPGTGDIQLSICQHFTLDGVLLVTTPQEVAFMDVKKAANMFAKMRISPIALVNNMAYYVNPNDNTKLYPFGENSAENYAGTLNIEKCFTLPIEARVSKQGDVGQPFLSSDESSEFTATILKVAKAIEEYTKAPLLLES